MSDGMELNGRDVWDPRTEKLLTGAGASIGLVLDDRQVHAVSLALEVFAYLLAALRAGEIDVRDVIKMMRFYSRGINDAKSSER